MQAYFEPKQVFFISMPQPVFEIWIPYVKKKHVCLLIINTIDQRKISCLINTEPSLLPASLFILICLIWRFLPTSSFIAPSTFIILAEICQPPHLFYLPLLFETRENQTLDFQSRNLNILLILLICFNVLGHCVEYCMLVSNFQQDLIFLSCKFLR